MQADYDDRSLQLEIICVDDCSTDGSLDILRQWEKRDKRVQVIQLERNSGQSVARNVALRHIHGDWLYFMDSDDVLLPDALFNLMVYARQTQADMVMFNASMINEQGASIEGQRYVRSNRFKKDAVYSGHEVMDTLLSTFSFRAVPWLYLTKTQSWRESDIWFPDGIIHEDETFTSCLIMNTERISVLPETLIQHRMRASSTMGQQFSLRNMDCYLQAVAAVEQWLGRHTEHRQMGRRYLRYTLTHVLITARCLPFAARMTTLRNILAHRYLPYVETKRLIQFIFRGR